MSTIAEMGQELSALWQQIEKLEEKQFHCRTDVTDEEKHIARAQGKAASDRLYALEAMIANSRAVDGNDAFAQLVLAGGHAGTVVDIGADDPEFAEKQAVLVHKLLMSVIAAFECHMGVSREEFGGRVYAARCHDPHLMEQAA